MLIKKRSKLEWYEQADNAGMRIHVCKWNWVWQYKLYAFPGNKKEKRRNLKTNKDCKKENLSDTEKKTAEYCCFIKDSEGTVCSALSKYQYKHIKDMIKNARLEGSGDDYSIDCKSLYLEISLLSLLLLLL